jgi:hypothetical protein
MDVMKLLLRGPLVRSLCISGFGLTAVVLAVCSACWSPGVARARSPLDARASAATSGAEGFRLLIDRTSVRAGGTVKTRVENQGSQAVTFGFPFRLEHKEAGAWQRIRGEGPFFAPLESVPPGRIGEAQDVPIPDWAPSGAVRVRKRVKPSTPEGRWRFITARFEVR